MGGSNPSPHYSPGGSAAIFLVTVWLHLSLGDGMRSTSGRGWNLYRHARPLRDTPTFPGFPLIVLPPFPKHIARNVAGKRLCSVSATRQSSCIATRLTSSMSARSPTYYSCRSRHSSDRASSVKQEKQAFEIISDRDQQKQLCSAFTSKFYLLSLFVFSFRM